MLIRKVAFISVVCALLGGCFLAPAIDSFNKLGVTASDRQNLLGERVQRFNDALFFGAAGDAEAFINPEKRIALEKEIRRQRREEKLVDSKIEQVAFEPEAYKAAVNLTVRYYKVPYYIVNERQERQDWVFSMSDGWRLDARYESHDER